MDAAVIGPLCGGEGCLDLFGHVAADVTGAECAID
jgi:hypothetical protein